MVTALTRGKKEVDVPQKDGRVIDNLINKGLQLKTRLEVTKEAIEANNGKIIPFAEELAGSTGLKSAVFRGSKGTVTVSFRDGIVYDPQDMDAIKSILGPVFTQMFHEVPSFAVNPEDIPEIRKRLGKDFDRLVQVQASYKHTKELTDLISNGDSATAKEVRKFVTIEAKKPTVSFERTAV